LAGSEVLTYAVVPGAKVAWDVNVPEGDVEKLGDPRKTVESVNNVWAVSPDCRPVAVTKKSVPRSPGSG
jgi:hypothetical protein